MGNPFAVGLNTENLKSRYVNNVNPFQARQIEPEQYTVGESVDYSVSYKSPNITGGTHINGLGVAGEKFDSFNLWK